MFFPNMPTEKVPLKAALALMATEALNMAAIEAYVIRETASLVYGGRKVVALDARSA